MKEKQIPSWIETPFVLFFGEQYYPSPGIKDYHEFFKTKEDAKSKAEEIKKEYSWYQIVDLFTFEIVDGYGKGHSGLLGLVDAGVQ